MKTENKELRRAIREFAWQFIFLGALVLFGIICLVLMASRIHISFAQSQAYAQAAPTTPVRERDNFPRSWGRIDLYGAKSQGIELYAMDHVKTSQYDEFLYGRDKAADMEAYADFKHQPRGFIVMHGAVAYGNVSEAIFSLWLVKVDPTRQPGVGVVYMRIPENNKVALAEFESYINQLVAP